MRGHPRLWSAMTLNDLSEQEFDALFPKLRSERDFTFLFVDGENLTMRAQDMLGSRLNSSSAYWRKDSIIWSESLVSITSIYFLRRKFYYTSHTGSEEDVVLAHKHLKQMRFEAPRVFKKQKSRGSKRVDITLATEALRNLFHRNYKNMILVAGDEDYVPLVESAQEMGAKVVLWFIPSGLSPHLADAADAYCDIEHHLFDASLKTQTNLPT